MRTCVVTGPSGGGTVPRRGRVEARRGRVEALKLAAHRQTQQVALHRPGCRPGCRPGLTRYRCLDVLDTPCRQLLGHGGMDPWPDPELVPCLSRLSVRVSVFNVNNPSFVVYSLRVIAPARPHPHVAWTISAPEIMAVGASELTNDWHLLWAASTLVQY